MNISKILPVIAGVLLNPYVIGAAVAVLLYCNFVSYVARYKKKPPKPKKKHVEPAPAPAPKPEGEEAGEEASQEE